jgi:hypothetical protein
LRITSVRQLGLAVQLLQRLHAPAAC